MGADKMKATAIGSVIELSRDQWNGHKAYISDYPGLLEAVQKYTWTYSGGEHPYLRSSKLKTSLHKFVLAFLYGADNLEKMLLPDNIIEHLDNNGLNCSYDNLHILSSDRNKAKAFSIDKEADKFHGIPLFIADVFYSHNRQYSVYVPSPLKPSFFNIFLSITYILIGCMFLNAEKVAL